MGQFSVKIRPEVGQLSMKLNMDRLEAIRAFDLRPSPPKAFRQ
jgi:hypothetical protein